MCLAKVIIIKIVSLKRRYESVRSCGCIFIQSLLVSVQFTVQSETKISSLRMVVKSKHGGSV